MPVKKKLDATEATPRKVSCGKCEEGWVRKLVKTTLSGTLKTGIVREFEVIPMVYPLPKQEVKDGKFLSYNYAVSRCSCMGEVSPDPEKLEPMPRQIANATIGSLAKRMPR